MKHDINLTILNWNGNLLAVTLPKEPKNGRLKVMQYQTYMDSRKRFTIAYEIVKQKIVHTFNLLKELSRYYSEVDLEDAYHYTS
jgi:CRISP-associated protein Cas1